jgi:hypothetical protein
VPKPRLTIAIIAALSLALSASACGGDDDSSEDEAQITDAIEQAATADTAEACTSVQTQAFTEQTEFATGEAAVTTCEQDAGNGDKAADTVEVSSIEIDGDTATAEVAFTGAGLDGQVLAVSLLKEGDQWKLDSLDEFINFDKASFANTLVAGAEADSEVPPQVVDCIRSALDQASEEQLQTAYLSGDEQQLVALFGPCFGG